MPSQKKSVLVVKRYSPRKEIMANPYHDETGKFCSRDEMKRTLDTILNQSIQTNEFQPYLFFRKEWDDAENLSRKLLIEESTIREVLLKSDNVAQRYDFVESLRTATTTEIEALYNAGRLQVKSTTAEDDWNFSSLGEPLSRTPEVLSILDNSSFDNKEIINALITDLSNLENRPDLLPILLDSHNKYVVTFITENSNDFNELARYKIANLDKKYTLKDKQALLENYWDGNVLLLDAESNNQETPEYKALLESESTFKALNRFQASGYKQPASFDDKDFVTKYNYAGAFNRVNSIVAQKTQNIPALKKYSALFEPMDILANPSIDKELAENSLKKLVGAEANYIPFSVIKNSLETLKLNNIIKELPVIKPYSVSSDENKALALRASTYINPTTYRDGWQDLAYYDATIQGNKAMLAEQDKWIDFPELWEARQDKAQAQIIRHAVQNNKINFVL